MIMHIQWLLGKDLQWRFVALRILGCPGPLVLAHVQDSILGLPSKLLLSAIRCSPHSHTVTGTPLHDLVGDLLSRCLLKSLDHLEDGGAWEGRMREDPMYQEIDFFA